ncbi:MAG: terpene cyclase/mutase family protein [Oscillospiraceae bacterium]|nr:terpene cyclase/mutase family protein [Oscillospiraceae bacterium]
MKQNNWKKWLVAVLVLALVMAMSACGKAEAKDADAARSACAQMLMDHTKEPVYGSLGGDWLALGFARGDVSVSEAWFEQYYAAVETQVKSCDGILHDRKYTEYSRVILALTAIGKDPRDVAGFNLLVPLADFEQTVFQGVNGPVFALLALDSGNYEIPENIADSTQATREGYVEYILNAEISGGGWSLAGGTAEVDLTAMTLQALAKYQDRADVAAAIERGLEFLSESQNEGGGFTSYGAQSSESVSQTIVALAELGIPLEDSRFVKKGNSLLDALLQFQQEDGSFAHLLDGERDLLSTEQAFYALVAANRMEQGESSLYRMK